MSTNEKDEQAPAVVNEEKPAPAPTPEPEEEQLERGLLGTGAAGAVIGGFIGGAGGAAFGGMLGLTGATLREDHKKKRRGWY